MFWIAEFSTELKPGIESIYCKISVRKQFKRTSVVPLKHRGCVWNQAKHMPTPVLFPSCSPFRSDADSTFRWFVAGSTRSTLFAFKCSPSTPPHPRRTNSSEPLRFTSTTLSRCFFLVCRFVSLTPRPVSCASQVTQVSGEFDLLDEHLFVGVIDLDVSFCYGLYGYGYSAQLKEEPVVRSVEDHLQFCLFPRVAPPPERTEWDRMTLAPTAISQPPFGMLKDVVPLSYAKELRTFPV